MMGEIFVRFCSGLPPSVKGAVRLDHEGDYNIYLNPAHSIEVLKRTLEHELMHIRSGDLEGQGDVNRMELIAYGGL